MQRVRIDIPWIWVEPNGPTVAAGHGHWGAIDDIMWAAGQHHLQVIPILAYSPEWASSTGELWTYPYAAPFEEFFAAALKRYPQIPAWELWNEPNFHRFSIPRPDPAAFVDFLRSARRARDSVGSKAKLIAGGIAPGGEIDVRSWIDQVALHGGLGLVDAFGFHPYSPADPDDPRSWMMQLEAVHRQLAAYGHPEMPLWLSEYGAPTSATASGYGPPLTEAQQATRLRLAFALASRFDWIQNLTWYEYRDGCADAADPECRFGLVRRDLTPKPSYTALREVIAGATVALRPRLFLASQVKQARVPVVVRASRHGKRKHKRRRVKRIVRRTVNRIVVSGKLTLPGTPWPNALLSVQLPRRGGKTKQVTVMVREGYFWARFDGRDLQPGTVQASFLGAPGYAPATTRIQVSGSLTRSR